jgi:hypothetical protein
MKLSSSLSSSIQRHVSVFNAHKTSIEIDLRHHTHTPFDPVNMLYSDWEHPLDLLYANETWVPLLIPYL